MAYAIRRYFFIYFLGIINSFFFFIFKLYITVISFAKYQNESATGIHVCPTQNPPPSSLPIPSLWVVPVHQPQASSIKNLKVLEQFYLEI